jgi:hypothetical protein
MAEYALLAGVTGKAGVSAKLLPDFPAFLIQFIELSRTAATMRFVIRVSPRFGAVEFDRTDSEHPGTGR